MGCGSPRKTSPTCAERTGNDGRPLFAEEFLGWLAELRFALDVDAVAEGTAVFPREPLLRVCGPIAQCQLVETALLNVINFQTLVATKASRVCLAAQGDPVVEFGLTPGAGTRRGPLGEPRGVCGRLRGDLEHAGRSSATASPSRGRTHTRG